MSYEATKANGDSQVPPLSMYSRGPPRIYLSEDDQNITTRKKPLKRITTNQKDIYAPPLNVIDKALLLQEKNPFDLPPDNKLFEMRDETIKNEKERHQRMIKQSIISRGMSALASTRSQSRHGKHSIIESIDVEVGISPPKAEHQRRQQMDEFVGQKREIFLVQLLIDRKNKEIQRIQNLRKTEKKNIAEEEAKIAEISNQYKMTTNQIDAELNREKKNMETAIRARTQSQKILKQKTTYVDAITAENTRNLETRATYQNYKKFLENLTPPDKEIFEFFTSPEVLLNEIEKVENENLFLISQCQELLFEQETVTSAVRAEIKEKQKESDELKTKMGKLSQVEQFTLLSDKESENEEIEAELAKVAALVTSTYEECFNEVAAINTLSRLERIENELEKLYREAMNIEPDFIKAKQAEKDKKRREEQRKAKAEEHQREQARKHKQALLRAQMPVKRKTGRPVYERILPIKISKNPVDEKQKLLEEQQLEKFLFGAIDY